MSNYSDTPTRTTARKLALGLRVGALALGAGALLGASTLGGHQDTAAGGLAPALVDIAVCGSDSDCELRTGIRMDGSEIREDDVDFDCRWHGNRVCGPASGGVVPAGCYVEGVLVVAWTNYEDPSSDRLYGQLEAPC